jgi:hypothetical protein
MARHSVVNAEYSMQQSDLLQAVPAKIFERGKYAGNAIA